MRIRIDHSTRYAYARPARFIIQTLRLTPRPDNHQHVLRWDVAAPGPVSRQIDAYGNVTHTLTLNHAHDEIELRVAGSVEIMPLADGVLYSDEDRLPRHAYCVSTPLTRPDAAIADFARSIAEGPPLSRMHALMAALRAEVAFEVGATSAAHTAAESFAQRRGVCQDHAQIFIACARRLGIPARYISGHLHRTDGAIDQDAAHAWAEGWVQGLGWVGFDPANGICPTEHYVRVASGLDALGASPIRGASYGGGRERMTVALRVRQMQQTQQQQQRQGR